MAASGVFFTWSSQLDRFLHATIETERNGTDLSVLSVLARVGHDPWREAARLAGLPRAAAADSLAATIACLPAGSPLRAHAGVLALCLVMLLPDQAHSVPDSPAAGKRHDGRMRATLLAGAMLSAALASGLLIGTMAWSVAHAGPLGVPEGATPASNPAPAGPAPAGQPFWPAPGGPWPA